ncbi:hypothetical protein BN2537_10593 [Streptomyces venezuelae]|nr:hypothetical protein BN2537_8303 [Streptomyces venezuelae]CUM40814.1 hypothetical protein BN2537_10593 [Streptomyces venezuelae]
MQANVLHGQLMGGTLISWHGLKDHLTSTASAWNVMLTRRIVLGTLLGI